MEPRYITVAAVDLPIRQEVYQDRSYLVAPVVAIVEGVVEAMGSAGPEFVSASEFRKAPHGWDGRPVFVNHPLKDNHPVPSNTPELLEEKAIGIVFNTKATAKKLTMEAWLDVEKTERIAPEILARIEDGEPLEVSVGAFVEVENEKGQFEGKNYDGVWRGIVPDHLAILPDQKGACSWAMGCGVRAAANRFTVIRKDGEKWCLFSKDGEKNLGCFNTRKKAEQREREVQFFKTQKGGNMCKTCETKGLAARLMAWFRSSELIDSDLRQALTEAISEAEGRDVWVESFKSEAQLVYYWFFPTPSEVEVFGHSGSSQLFQRSYTQTDDRVSVGDDREEVTRKTDYIIKAAASGAPTATSDTASKEMKIMREKAKVDALIAVSNGVFTDSDQTLLESATDEQFKRFEEKFAGDTKVAEEKAAAEKKAADEQVAAEKKTADEKAAAERVAAEKNDVTEETYLAGAPAGIRDVLAEGLKVGREKRVATIKALKDSGRCDLTDEQLTAMSQSELNSLVKLANVRAAVDFSGQAPRTTEKVETEAPAPPDLVGIMQADRKK